MTVDKLSSTINPGESALFQFTLINTGGTTAHPFASAEGPEGWELTFSPPHQPTEPGATEIQELGVRVPPNTPVGTYQVNATIEYEKGNQPQSQLWQLRVNVGDVPPGGASGARGNATAEGDDPGEESPGVGALVLVGALAALAWVRRRD